MGEILVEVLEVKSVSHCVQCHRQLEEKILSFEQRLVEADQWCEKCWSEMMIDADLSYLENPNYLSLAP